MEESRLALRLAFTVELIIDSLYLSSNGSKFSNDGLVAAVNMIDAVDRRLAIGTKSGKHKRRRCTKVRCYHPRACELRRPINDRMIACDRDIGPHSNELRSVHKTIFEDRLFDMCGSLGLGHQSHILSLHIRWKQWVRLSGYIQRLQSFCTSSYMKDAFGNLVDLNSHSEELVDQSLDMSRLAITNFKFAVGDGSSDNESSCFNTIGDDRVLGPAKFQRLR